MRALAPSLPQQRARLPALRHSSRCPTRTAAPRTAAPRTAAPRAAAPEPSPRRERRLRYPSGEERVIRYSADALGWLCTGPGISGAPGAPPAGSQPSSEVPPATAPQRRPPPPGAFPATPAALARLAASPERRAAAEAARVAAASSYALLRHAPPGGPGTAYVIADYDAEGNASLFSMRTRLDAGAQESNLAAELGLSPGALRVADMRDGLLAFEAQEDAERYAALLEADGHAAEAAGAETAALFTLCAEAKAIVVWFRAAAAPPLPAELAMLLRNAREEA